MTKEISADKIRFLQEEKRRNQQLRATGKVQTPQGIKQINTPKQDSKKPNPKKQPDQFDWMRAGKTSLVWLMIIFG